MKKIKTIFLLAGLGLTTVVNAGGGGANGSQSSQASKVNTATNYSDKAALEAERINKNATQVKTLGQNAATSSKQNKGATSKQIQTSTLAPATPVATKAAVTTPTFKAADADALAAERKNTKTIRTANPSMPNK